MKPMKVFLWKTDWPNAAVWTIECDDERICTQGRLCSYPSKTSRFYSPSDKRFIPALHDSQKIVASNLLGLRDMSEGFLISEVEFYRGGMHIILKHKELRRIKSPYIRDIESVLTHTLGSISFGHKDSSKT